MIPIHLDALVLPRDQPVIEASADFSQLPYSDSVRDVNGDTAYISEEIVREPLQDENLFLQAGIHLHWSLPDALTKGSHTADGTDFPAVPNRWLVIRSGPNVVRKRWVVESDYLYPDGAGADSGAISFPVAPDPVATKYCPFRFVGQTVPFESWSPNAGAAEYLEKLTAVGYGDPTFAALYPNCHSVFGFHDEEFAANVPPDLQYDLVGWYSDPKKDCLVSYSDGNNAGSFTQILAAIEKNLAWTLDNDSVKDLFPQAQQDQVSQYLHDHQQTSPSSASALLTSIEADLGFAVDPGESLTAATLFYARVTFPSNPSVAASSLPANSSVTVANSGTEALSAQLAQQLATSVAAAEPDQIPSLKSTIEDQLEAISFSSRLAGWQLDIGPKFRAARHEKGFTAIPGGAVWTITKQSAVASPANASDANAQLQITLPADLAHLLNNLNLLQQQFDTANAEIESDRRQIFADWYKYLLCAYPPDDAMDSYPDMDEVRSFVEVEDLAPLQAKLNQDGEFSLLTDSDGNITGASSSPGTSSGSLAGQLAKALNDCVRQVSDLNASDAVKKANAVYRLSATPAPRFYQPNNPVVLLTGPDVTATNRHGQDGSLRDDGLLECQLFPGTVGPNDVPTEVDAITARMDQIAQLSTDNFAFSDWTEQPWNPFLLEWEVEVFPVEEQGNLRADASAYESTFIDNTYWLDENAVDMSVRAGKGTTTRAANVYTGTSILTPQAGMQTQGNLTDYLNQAIMAEYYQAQNVPPEQQADSYLSQHLDAIQQWYEQQHAATLQTPADKAADPIYTALSAAQWLPTLDCLSQALGGFNEALLMRKQTLQLDIADPLAFDDHTAFIEEVRSAVQQSITSAPQPLSDFNPIRTGALRLIALRLIDTFGQTRDVDCREVLTTELLKVDNDSDEMTLPPRLTQPARVNLRWLSASADEQEMNDHPDTTPICGWVLPNNLDNSLMIYAADGTALGSIDEEGKWESAPGSNNPVAADSIPNAHLKKMVAYVIGQEAARRAEAKPGETPSSFLQNFISALDTALSNIDPENFAQHQDLALLMGRPIALVRATVDLQLQGRPAIHQGWNVFRQDLDRNQRETNDFDTVSFPIRLGEFNQFNDGLVGYWNETGGEYEGDVFYSPQSDPIDDPSIRTHANDPMTIHQTVTSPPHFLTMLIDPRGIVNATSGILPVKAISIPPDQYTDALKAIEITFLSTPILAEVSKMRLPLPAEPGFTWSWLQKGTSGWTEISAGGMVRKAQVNAAFPANADAVWDGLKASGWIIAIDDQTATITPRDKRTQATLESDLVPQTNDIENFLESIQLGSPNPGAVLPGPQQIVEGWLKLSNS